MSWISVNNGLADTMVNSFAVLGINLWAGTNSGKVYLSMNNGETWTEVVSTGNEIDNIMSFAVTDSFLFAATNSGIFRSGNSGETWTNVERGLYASSLAVFGGYLFAGWGSGDIYRSRDNGVSWAKATNGRPTWESMRILLPFPVNISLLEVLLKAFSDPGTPGRPGLRSTAVCLILILIFRLLPLSEGISLLDSWAMAFTDPGTMERAGLGTPTVCKIKE